MTAQTHVTDVTGTDGTDHEAVLAVCDPTVGLQATIAIHSTRLGPALGGTRARVYADPAEARRDVLNLSEAMTLKAAAAGLDLGGGKAVIELAPGRALTGGLLERYAQVVDSLGGIYITAEDIGVGQGEIDVIARTTPHAVGTSHGVGDPSPWTARGVVASMGAALATLGGPVDWRDLRLVVVGVGKVGGGIVRLLSQRGARVAVADVDARALTRVACLPGVEVVDLATAHLEPCDVLAPCALGGYVTERVVDELECHVVAGSANNQLADDRIAGQLAEVGIVYVPDFVANAGGLICVDVERRGADAAELGVRVDALGDTTAAVLAEAAARDVTPLDAALAVARARLDNAT